MKKKDKKPAPKPINDKFVSNGNTFEFVPAKPKDKAKK